MSRSVLAALAGLALLVTPLSSAAGEAPRPFEAVSTHDHVAPPTTAGALTLSDLRTLATPPNARAGGGFVTITNGGADNRLVGASSPRATRVELHTMVMDGDVMRMREVEGGIALPAGETVELAPGGLHIMFMGLENPFVEGETVPVTLTFEGGETIEVVLPVLPRQMEGNGHAHGSHN